MKRRARLCALFALGAPLLSAAGCVTDEVSANVNVTPVANAGPDQQHAYEGVDIDAELDGSGSSDRDGEIVRYHWQSGDVTPTATGGVTAGDLPDPDDEARPRVQLGEGVWLFQLWVTDDEGSVSAPDHVRIVIGEDPAGACLTAASERAPETCRECVCGMDHDCQSAFIACDDACWDRITCIRGQCASGTSDDPDEACVREHCAADATAQALLDTVLVDTCISACPLSANCYQALIPRPEQDGGVDDDAGN